MESKTNITKYIQNTDRLNRHRKQTGCQSSEGEAALPSLLSWVLKPVLMGDWQNPVRQHCCWTAQRRGCPGQVGSEEQKRSPVPIGLAGLGFLLCLRVRIGCEQRGRSRPWQMPLISYQKLQPVVILFYACNDTGSLKGKGLLWKAQGFVLDIARVKQQDFPGRIFQ